MAGESEKSERGFVVIDRRGQEEEAEPAPAAEPSAARGAGEPPPIDFSTFLLSLGTSALYHLGLVPDPATGEPAPAPDLALARQTIDTLELLESKTRGNLEAEESKLLESLLYELRMRFVQAREGSKRPSEKDAG